MNESVRVIRWLVSLSIFSLILTYVVSVNSELGLLCLNSPYISNNFVFSIFGGVFASIVVMLACEIRKYIDLKINIRNMIYSQFAFMYGQLRITYDNINFYLDTPSEIVPSNLFHFSIENIKNSINNLNNLDYTLLYRKDKISNVIEDFKLNKQQILNEYLTDCINFDIALRTDSINNKSARVTSASPKTKVVLQILKASEKTMMEYIDNYLQSIDSQCKNKYEWNNTKNDIDGNMEQHRYMGLDDFIKRKSNIFNNKEKSLI